MDHDINGAVLADNARKVYPIHSVYYNIREKVYKNMRQRLFVGAGLSFEIRRNITNKDTAENATPSSVYNNIMDFRKTSIQPMVSCLILEY